MSKQPEITLTITIPESAVESLNSFVNWARFETYLQTSPSKDTETAFELKYAIQDICNAINAAAREVQP